MDLYIKGCKSLLIFVCFISSMSRGVEKYFPRVWGTCTSDAVILLTISYNYVVVYPKEKKNQIEHVKLFVQVLT